MQKLIFFVGALIATFVIGVVSPAPVSAQSCQCVDWECDFYPDPDTGGTSQYCVCRTYGNPLCGAPDFCDPGFYTCNRPGGCCPIGTETCECGVNANGNCRPCDASISCTPQVNCAAGYVRTSTVVSETCDASQLCGDNAWGTGGGPGNAQAVGECCNWGESGGGNCEWVSCPTPANPGKLCKVCDPVETWCTNNSLYTYECVSNCSATNPSSFTLSSPANGTQIANTNVSLLWNAVSSWGTSCAGTSQYQVIIDTNINPTTVYATVGSGVTQDVFVGSVGTTYHWKIRAFNGSVYTDSEVRSFTIVQNQIVGTVYIDTDATCDTSNGGTLPGLGVRWGNDTATINANGSYTITASQQATQAVYLTGIPAGYICSTACGSEVSNPTRYLVLF